MSDTPMGEGWWQASDGKYYPPQSYPPPVQARRSVGKWLGIAALAFVGLIVVLAAIGATVAPPVEDPAALATVEAPTSTKDTAATPPETTAAPITAVPTTSPPPTAPPTSAAPTTTAAPPTTTVPTTLAPRPTAPPTTAAPSDGLSVSQRNAVREAKSYLAYTAFSRSGLIEQLMYEDYSQADAAYAVDAIGADWNAQAAKEAKGYLEYTSFSRQGLIDQLLYEGYTQAQAEYGVGTTGL